jgi:hypothetical protein
MSYIPYELWKKTLTNSQNIVELIKQIMLKRVAILLIAFILAWGSSYAATVNVFLSAPGSQSSSQGSKTTEDFDSLQRTALPLTGTFSVGIYTISRFPSPSNTPKIEGANQWGGAEGNGNYMFSGSSAITVNFANTARYVGLWWSSAGDDDNVKLYGWEDGVETLFREFTIADLSSMVGSKNAPNNVVAYDGKTYSGSSYFGNPNGGTETSSIFTFINFQVIEPGLTFSKVSLSGVNFEVDNLTSSPVPEPSAFSLLAIGLGGLALVRRRRS